MIRGDIILVPFPFTDLTGQKRRPALVVSPDGFDPEDVVLCAITSRVTSRPLPWDVPLRARDLVDGALPRPSAVKVGKLFTMHQALIAGRFGRVREEKLTEVLRALQRLFER
ncbi:MAG: type II toxin-antitoxin system PemK/MazF family toxin [Chloroflexi bacterium]|nr:type II toxin-antitoxin system PemK/MazF family toxin [Chloroflexota bacterium]